jgi:hypothetical protein
MNPLFVLVLVGSFTALLVIVVSPIIMERAHMERRAREILAHNPDAETISLYVPFRSVSPVTRRREMNAKIEEMEAGGWQYLKASEANVARTSKAWGGGLNLHFIRTG